MAASVAASADTLKRVNANTRNFLKASETLAEITNDCGAVTPDTPFIEAVQRGAARLSAALEQAVAQGRISLADLFDDKYQPVPGSNPAQVTTRFVALTDELFPPVQEELLAFDPQGRVLRGRRPQRLPAHPQPQVLAAAGRRPGVERRACAQSPHLQRPHRAWRRAATSAASCCRPTGATWAAASAC